MIRVAGIAAFDGEGQDSKRPTSEQWPQLTRSEIFCHGAEESRSSHREAAELKARKQGEGLLHWAQVVLGAPTEGGRGKDCRRPARAKVAMSAINRCAKV
jgi:hypothetical protein